MKLSCRLALIVLGLSGLAGWGAPPVLAPAGPAAASQRAVVLEVHLDGMIEPVSAGYVEQGIADANRLHASAILIEINTPGGLETSMRGIIRSIFASAVPVITYVAPSGSRAASAGFFILLSGDVAVMAPGTNTGAAHPVLLSGASMGKTEALKVENDAAAYIRSIAGQRGRNAQLAEAGVRQSQSFTEREALEGHLINAIAASPEDIFTQFDGKTIPRINGSATTLHLAGARIENYSMTSRQRFLSHLADPNLAFILLAIGAVLLYVEFTHPGVILPGIAGAISVVLALYRALESGPAGKSQPVRTLAERAGMTGPTRSE